MLAPKDPPAAEPHFTTDMPQHLSVRYTWLCCVLLYFYCVMAGLIATALHLINDDVDLTFLLEQYLLAPPLLLLLTVYTVISSRAKGYRLQEHHMSFHQGVMFQSVTVQPFSRLQHIEITRGPLERLFGLATLKLFSAGGSQHAVAVPGLPLGRAEYLRSCILDSKGLAHEQ